jgi:hypothetical protein
VFGFVPGVCLLVRLGGWVVWSFVVFWVVLLLVLLLLRAKVAVTKDKDKVK